MRVLRLRAQSDELRWPKRGRGIRGPECRDGAGPRGLRLVSDMRARKKCVAEGSGARPVTRGRRPGRVSPGRVPTRTVPGVPFRHHHDTSHLRRGVDAPGGSGSPHRSTTAACPTPKPSRSPARPWALVINSNTRTLSAQVDGSPLFLGPNSQYDSSTTNRASLAPRTRPGPRRAGATGRSGYSGCRRRPRGRTSARARATSPGATW